jgi:hypothetical protein
MTVFAFDRDWTVDVNPHPHREAVPLEWVRHLAHETDHPVYAIGNQTLAEEAAIPGVVDIVGRHTDHWDEWLGRKQPDGRYERFPTRRERLGLLTDLHPGENQFIVVDDIDLSDVNGWEHYFAWDFVEAVRNGDIDPGLPWCDLRADGGLPTTAGIMPPDVDSLRSFLEEYDDADAFEIKYTDEDGTHNRILADITVLERTVRRPAAANAVECVGLPPGSATFALRVDKIQMVNVVDPPDELFEVKGQTPEEQVAEISEIAELAPARVPTPALINVLKNGDEDIRGEALNVLEDLTETRPREWTSVLPVLKELLQDTGHKTDVMNCIASIAEEKPGDVAPIAGVVTAQLDSEDDERVAAAARCLGEITDHDPADIIAAVPALESVVARRKPGFEYALFALNRVADVAPRKVRPAADTLAKTVADDSLDTGPRLNATAALGYVTKEFPDAGADIVKEVAGLLDVEDQMLRANAAGLLSDIAEVHAAELVPFVDELELLLDSSDDYALINTTAALSRVAELHPEAVTHLVEKYISLLDHDHRLVRLNSCWALGHLQAAEASSKLDAIRTSDADEQVRTRAAWAVSEINSVE